MGCVYALPSARDGPSNGVEEFQGGLVCVPRGRGRLCQRHADDLVHERVRLSHRDWRQTHVQPPFRIPAILRIDHSIWGIRIALWNVVSESVATFASSFTQEQAFLAGDS